VRVGIETGEAVVDLDGLAERQRMVLGACVNLAARLQQQAAPGEILVGPGCYAATTDTAVFDELGLRPLKGFGEVEIRRLERMTDTPRPEPAFVGREPEWTRCSPRSREPRRDTRRWSSSEAHPAWERRGS